MRNFMLPPEIVIKFKPAKGDIGLATGWQVILLRMLFFEFFESSWEVLTSHDLIGFFQEIFLTLGIPYSFNNERGYIEIYDYMIQVIFVLNCDRGEIH